MRTPPSPETALMYLPALGLVVAILARRRARLLLNENQRRRLRALLVTSGLFLGVGIPIQVLLTREMVRAGSYPVLNGAVGDVLLVGGVTVFSATAYGQYLERRRWRGSADGVAVVAALIACLAAGASRVAGGAPATDALVTGVLAFGVTFVAGHLVLAAVNRARSRSIGE